MPAHPFSPYQILDVGGVEVFSGIKHHAVVGVRDTEDVLDGEVKSCSSHIFQ